MPSVCVTASSSSCSASTLRDHGHGASSQSGSSSCLRPAPVGAYANAMLCATMRRAPAATAAATRLRVPSVRMRSLPAACSSILRGSSAGGRSVSSCTTTSGCAPLHRRRAALRVEHVAHHGHRARLAQRRRAVLAARHRRHVVAAPPAAGAAGGGRSRPVAPARKTLTRAPAVTSAPAGCGLPAAARGCRTPASGRRTRRSAAQARRSWPGPASPGSVPPMSNRWLTVWSALPTNAANRIGTRHAGRPAAASSAMPDSGLERAEVAQEVVVGAGRTARSRPRTSPGRSPARRRSRAASARGSGAPAASSPSVRRGPGNIAPLLPSISEPRRDCRRCGRGRQCDRCHTGRDVPAARRPVRHMPPPAPGPQHAGLDVLAVRAVADRPRLPALSAPAGGGVPRIRARGPTTRAEQT